MITRYIEFGDWVIVHAFLSSADFFQNHIFSKNYFRNTTRLLNGLDPDQARHFVERDLDPHGLQKFTAGDTSSQRLKVSFN